MLRSLTRSELTRAGRELQVIYALCRYKGVQDRSA